MLHDPRPDVRFGVRILRHRTLSAATVLTFGLGIGLATAAFNAANCVLLGGLPFEDSGRIALVSTTDAASGGELRGVAVHDYAVIEERQRVFESLGAFTWVSVAMAWDGRRPERLSGAAINVSNLLPARACRRPAADPASARHGSRSRAADEVHRDGRAAGRRSARAGAASTDRIASRSPWRTSAVCRRTSPRRSIGSQDCGGGAGNASLPFGERDNDHVSLRAAQRLVEGAIAGIKRRTQATARR